MVLHLASTIMVKFSASGGQQTSNRVPLGRHVKIIYLMMPDEARYEVDLRRVLLVG